MTLGGRAASLLAMLCAAMLALPAQGQVDARSTAVRDAQRELWTPGASRALRAWLVRGADAPLANEAALAPSGPGDGWTAYAAWTDVAELSAGPGRYVYAVATANRAEDGPADLLLGATAPLRIWVNGESVANLPAARALTPDHIRARVQLRRGANRIVVRAESDGGPARLTMRILAPGQPMPSPMAAWLGVGTDGRLFVQSDLNRRAGTAAVAVIAPGGRIVAAAQGERGTAIPLDAAAWPDGPYEIRVATSDAFSAPRIAWLPWYKGDPAPAARRLLERAAAATGDDAASGHWRMLRDLLVDRAGPDLSRLASAPASVHAVLTEAAELEAGDAAVIRPSGMVRLGWIDPVDGSTQFCRAYLPPDYDANRPTPTIVYLHGYNPANPPYIGFWRVDSRHDETADRHGVIWIEAHGRANTQYLGIGERDVLRCIEEAKRRLAVDPDRLYLNGESMGGSGTWLIASRHPELFAAIAPIFGGWDNRLLPGFGGNDPGRNPPMERWIAEMQSSFAGAEQLNATPIFVQHGDADPAVSVEHSRHIVRLLQRWGYDIRYRELPGWAHEDMQYRDEVVTWFLGHRRAAPPRTVRIRATDLDGAGAWWLRATAALGPMAMIEADAEMVAPSLLRLDTRNVAGLTLTPPPALLAPGPLRVVWNGREVQAAQGRGGHYTLTAPGAPGGPLRKRAGLSGGLSSAFATPFVIVVGTSSADPDMRRRIREGADRLAAQWRGWQHVAPRMVDDVALTAQMERGLTLVLLGGPDANSVSDRLARRLPLGLTRDSVTIDGRRFAAQDALVELLYPNPSAPDRYVMVVAGTSAAAFGMWNPASYWHPALGFGTNLYDWIVRHGTRPLTAPDLLTERGWIASGLFNQGWRRDDRWTFLGNAAAREQPR